MQESNKKSEKNKSHNSAANPHSQTTMAVIDPVKSQLILYLQTFFEVDESLLQKTADSQFGDYTYPCFSLAKVLKKSPVQIAQDLVEQIVPNELVLKVEAVNGYLNIHLDKVFLVRTILSQTITPTRSGKILIEASSPNIAKAMGIGHLRSTIIGWALANIHREVGYDVTTINYWGDWGTQFGKLIYAYMKYGDSESLKSDPISYLQDLYIRVNAEMTPEIEAECRDIFKRLEEGDSQIYDLWKTFREMSLLEFQRMYDLLGVTFDVNSGESFYTKGAKDITAELLSQDIATKSDGAIIVNLEDYNLGVSILQKSDGTSIYASRDLAAAIERKNVYNFTKMIYEVGAEQSLHFGQVFKTLELGGYAWAKDCVHVSHGLYLGTDGKKLSTRKGTSLKMKDIWADVSEKVVAELTQREVDPVLIAVRAPIITRAAVIFADLFNYREKSVIINPEKMAKMEGDTGPYLLYSYARSRSILRKLGVADSGYVGDIPVAQPELAELELVKFMDGYHSMLLQACDKCDPSLVANYAQKLSRLFNTFYSSCPVFGSESQDWRGYLVWRYSEMLRNCLRLLGIAVLEEM